MEGCNCVRKNPRRPVFNSQYDVSDWVYGNVMVDCFLVRIRSKGVGVVFVVIPNGIHLESRVLEV